MQMTFEEMLKAVNGEVIVQGIVIPLINYVLILER